LRTSQSSPELSPVLLSPPPPEISSLLDEGPPLLPDVALPAGPVPLDPLDEPLVAVAGLPVLDAYCRLGVTSDPRPPRVRVSVLARLLRANALLPPRFSIVVLDGWRSRSFQARLVRHYNADPSAGYVSDPDSTVRRPPHLTGGAVDLTLGFGGTPLALGSDFDWFDHAAHRMSFEDRDGPVRRLRRLLEGVLVGAGLAPYPLEWWHWSYGDDIWASANACPSLYDTIPEEA